MSFSMLNIGRTGLNSAQKSLDVTGHNISNVNTAGYSRQVVEQTSVIGDAFGTSMQGIGTRISSIERSFNDLTFKNLLFNSSNHSYYENLFEQHQQIEDQLADADTGLTTSLEQFFDSVNGVTEEPTLLAARNVFITNAEVTAQRFNSLNESIQRQSKSLNTNIESTVTAINEISDQITFYNEQIQIATAQSGDRFPPNDLLDKRSQAINELSQLVDVQILQRDQNMIDVTIGQGTTLVTGITSLKLSTERNEYDSNIVEITLSTDPSGSNSVNIQSRISGGTLGSFIDFQQDVLIPASQDLGKIALGYSDMFNRQQSLGLDLNGNVGANIFADINDPGLAQARSLGSSNNAVNSVLSVTIRNTELVTGDDYLMEYDGVNITFTDKSGTPLPPPAAPFAPPAAGTIVEIPGTGIGIEIVTNNLAAGDSYLIRPTYNAAESIDVVITDPREVAAAQSDLTQTSINNPNNIDFELYAVDNPADANYPTAAAPIRIEIDAGGTNYRVTDNLGGVLVAYAPIPNDMPIEAAGLRFDITGNIAGGEVFEIGVNNPSQFGVGDNRNMLEMLNFQTEKMLDGGTNSLTESFGDLLSFMGNSTSTAKVQKSAFETSLAMVEQDMATTSGVNLDEEAANLIRYQQTYSAAAQVITVANTVLDTLLQAVR